MACGYLLNDNDIGVDHLGEFTFADALAESIHQVDTPITIGIFARWGTGKSFLLRHLESILKRYQRQDTVDDAKKERYPDGGRCKSATVWKLVLWAVCVVFLVLVLICSLILAIHPAIFVVLFTEHGEEYLHTFTVSYDNATTVTSAPEAPPEYLSTLKIVGMLLIPIEISIVFVVGCCGNTWLSRNYYGSFRLITYGTFTKLPSLNNANEIVEDPGQNPAEVLKYIRPGDERLAIAASESIGLSRRYIFVDFKAWEYAGSDTLWAGIVTKLSDAIESQFGVITARLFRMLHVQDIPKNRLDVSERTLYVQFSYVSQECEIRDMMRQYGVVLSCEKHSSVVEKNGYEYWKVTYSNEGEFRSAKDCLAIEGVKFQTYPPGDEQKNEKEAKSPKFHRGGPIRVSNRPLIGEEAIEMETMNRSNGDNGNEEEALDRLKLPPRNRCCSRFCTHFMRYPVKTCCMPRLVWWILILTCAILIPVVVYIIAQYLNLDVFRTYRNVPVAGQVLLWLPASSAVTVVVCRFLWAMCHSQRRRINQALDGTKSKMADELGFMDKIKTEISVITKLIHCARFTHQQDFKVVITIDDLDRVPLEKVKAVLEAVSILLSDKSSPFVCLVAVDPRIVVKCIEEGMGQALIKANVTGHEYLKKIINLPICLPEVGNPGKRRFIAGLIDQADHSVTYRAAEGRPYMQEQLTEEDNFTRIDGGEGPWPSDSLDRLDVDGSSDDELDSPSFVNYGRMEVSDNSGVVETPERIMKPATSAHRNKRRKLKKSGVSNDLDHKRFLFECRKHIYEDEEMHKHLVGNPRNIKRIFNTISLTACIINCCVKKQQRRHFIHTRTSTKKTDEIIQDYPVDRRVETVVRTTTLARDLVRWIVLADQWPYRTSYILQVIEDADQRETAGIRGEKIPDKWTIFEIFQKKVATEFKTADRSLLGLDADPDVFYSYLRLLGNSGFTKEHIVEMEKHTVNLDYSIRHSIAFARDLSCMDPPVAEKNDGDAKNVPDGADGARSPDTDRDDHGEHQIPRREENESQSAGAGQNHVLVEKLTTV